MSDLGHRVLLAARPCGDPKRAATLATAHGFPSQLKLMAKSFSLS